MKIRVLDRILVALAGLLMVVGGVALAAELFFGKNVSGKVSQWLADGNNRVFIIITKHIRIRNLLNFIIIIQSQNISIPCRYRRNI